MSKRVFISYRRQTSIAIASQLTTTLRLKHQFDVFRDETDLRDVGTFEATLKREIDSCDVLVCLLADGTMDSEWVNMEVEYAYSRRIPLIPVFQHSYQTPPLPHTEAVAHLVQSHGVQIDDHTHRHVEHSMDKVAEIIHNVQSRAAQQSLEIPPLRVLIIDDDLGWQKIIRRSLEQMDCQFKIEEVASYEDALEYIERYNYDLIITDLRLRRGTDTDRGVELAWRIREVRHNQACGLIIITAHGDESKRGQLIYQYKADDFIFKEAFGPEFGKTIQRVLRTARQRHATIDQRTRYNVRLTFDGLHRLTDIITVGRDELEQMNHLSDTTPLDLSAIIERTALLATSTQADAEATRRAAVQFGKELHDQVLASGAGQLALQTARLKSETADIIVEIEGNLELLHAPLELVTLARPTDRLAIMRKLRQQTVRNALPLHEVIAELQEQRLGFLLVGVGEDVRAIARRLDEDLNCLGIRHHITVLDDEHATLTRFNEEISIHNTYHFLHFAGWQGQQGIPCLYDNYGALKPIRLDRVVGDLQHQPLKCIFIDQPVTPTDSLMKMISELLQSGTATLIGYRWPPTSAYAQAFTRLFYTHIWREFTIYNSFIQAHRKAEEVNLAADWQMPIYVANALI